MSGSLVAEPTREFKDQHLPNLTMMFIFSFVYSGWGGFTPLHYAALHGHRALVDFFLSTGADPNLTCDAGQTAFHFACR